MHVRAHTTDPLSMPPLVIFLYDICIQIRTIQLLSYLVSLKNSCPCRDLNAGPPPYQADMLPIELSWLGLPYNGALFHGTQLLQLYLPMPLPAFTCPSLLSIHTPKQLCVVQPHLVETKFMLEVCLNFKWYKARIF